MRFASGPLYVSHSIPAKAEGEALALGKAEALAQHGSCVRTELATENCTKAPGIGPPITQGGREGRAKDHHHTTAQHAHHDGTCAGSSRRKDVQCRNGNGVSIFKG